MRRIGITFIFCFLVSAVQSQDKNHHTILDKFIQAHNVGTEKAISDFIRDTYSPQLYKKIDLAKHVAFYSEIVKEFGPLNPIIYNKVKESPLTLEVQLVKKNAYVLNKNIDPLEILVVTIDFDTKDQSYLSRGLGLGSLACTLRKE